MADDRMKHDDLNRNMGGTKGEGQEYGQQTPGRNPQGGQAGQQGAGQQGGQSRSGQQGGATKEPRNAEDEDDFGGAGRSGGMNRGGQNR